MAMVEEIAAEVKNEIAEGVEGKEEVAVADVAIHVPLPDDVAIHVVKYDVERIIGERSRKKVQQYKVRWANMGPSHNSWEPASVIAEASAAAGAGLVEAWVEKNMLRRLREKTPQKYNQLMKERREQRAQEPADGEPEAKKAKVEVEREVKLHQVVKKDKVAKVFKKYEVDTPNPNWTDEQYANVTEEQLLKQLQATEFVHNKSRVNTKFDAKSIVQGFCVGAIKSFRTGIVMSRQTLKVPHLTRMMCSFINRHQPDFKYTSVQVNKNYASALHVDNGNLGPSYIYGLGDYNNGDLYIHGEGSVPVKGTWKKFDGNIPHLTCPFTGERFTLIYFTNQSYGKIRSPDGKDCRKLGFQWPAKGLTKHEYPPKRERLDEAREALPEDMKHLAGSVIKEKLNTSCAANMKRKRLEAKKAEKKAARAKAKKSKAKKTKKSKKNTD